MTVVNPVTVTSLAVTIPANLASPLTRSEVPAEPTAPIVTSDPVATEVPIPTSFRSVL